MIDLLDRTKPNLDVKFEVIPAKTWKCDDGRTASIYGALPWRSDDERDRWSLVEHGWTVRNPYTGEIGACRIPWSTKEEAEAFAERVPPSRVGYGD